MPCGNFNWQYCQRACVSKRAVKRAQREGTDLIGDYNYRTNTMDAGTDPYGWYEEDM